MFISRQFDPKHELLKFTGDEAYRDELRQRGFKEWPGSALSEWGLGKALHFKNGDGPLIYMRVCPYFHHVHQYDFSTRGCYNLDFWEQPCENFLQSLPPTQYWKLLDTVDLVIRAIGQNYCIAHDSNSYGIRNNLRRILKPIRDSYFQNW